MIKKLLKKILNICNQIYKVRLRFDLPIKNKILLFDETHSNTLREIVNKDFNILKVRSEKEVYFWILLRQVIIFDFKFVTYCENYIKFISPKIIITFIDTNIDFYKLKNKFNHIKFISVQNGLRTADWFQSKKMSVSKNLKCDHIFVFNKYIINKYKKHINSNYHTLGNFKNNIIKVNKTKIHNQFLFISQFNKTDKIFINFQKKLLKYINIYILYSNSKLHILLRSKNPSDQLEEMKFYKKIFQSNCIFLKSLKWKKAYKIIDNFENIIFMYSTLGFEAIARKKKVAIFSPDKILGFKYYFGWPRPFQKRHEYFLGKKLTYSEIKRVLGNISKCSQTHWQKKYYSVIKDEMYLNQGNVKLEELYFN